MHLFVYQLVFKKKMFDLVSWLLELNIKVSLLISNDSKNCCNAIFVFVFRFLKL